jgi:hypothetical protein
MADTAALATRYEKEILLWQEFLDKYGDEEQFEDVIFTHMALGFFIAQGVTNEIRGGDPFADADDLAYEFGG